MSFLKKILPAVQNGNPTIEISGMPPSAQAYWLSRLILEGPKKNYLYVGATGKEALNFRRDVEFFLGGLAQNEVASFPAWDVLPFSNLSPHHDLTSQRLGTLFRLSQRTAPSLITTHVAALLPLLPPKSIFQTALTLKSGMEQDRDQLVTTLTEWGYQSVPLVIDRGNFAVRGAIVDLFCPLHEFPLRLEWLGDTLESLRFFDPTTQRSLGPQEEVTLIPVREVSLTDDTKKHFAKHARAHAEERDLTRLHWAPWAEKISEGIPFTGFESYLPLFYETLTSFRDWLPADTIIILGTKTNLASAAEKLWEDVETLFSGDKKGLLETSDRLLSPQNFEKALDELSQITFPTFSSPEAQTTSIETHGEIRREIELTKKGLEPLAPLTKRLKGWLMTDSVILLASTLAQAERLKDLLSHHFPQAQVLEKASLEIAKGTLAIEVGDVSGGFRLPEEGVCLITEEEIFGKKVRKKNRDFVAKENLSSFSDIKEGDPVVHKNHGIGLYRGLNHMEIDGCANDFFLLEYRGGDKLYLPIYRMNLVQRYTGGESPALDKLGGTGWIKAHTQAEKTIRSLAGDLLNLYAARSAGEGFAFSPPNELFEAFEASFPYEETADQEKAIQDVLTDMQAPRPMDRLVLGDVGYGKTEVALRAAFKAVLDGKQVCLLVPTTLLAFQHFERFKERFKDYAVRIDMLSRFRSATEQKKTIKSLAEGTCDIIIGTHRLLQADISFKNLGLFIIDEEHRFGVDQKEKVKRLKKSVDVLALSATPIPRTLHMSLVGIRNVSVIETPPTDRLAIRTFVMPFQENVVREAIMREFKRGGQVFFVHNEVESIGRMKERLSQLVPEIKIEVGHGQMEEDHLEKVMIRFFHQEFHLLLCTTIIESGIDIPTANTIIINNADRFGLAQIYQLRGRVGRGNHRAYSYLLVPDEKKLTPEATQRLAVLQRFSELGSGYRIASYDLEIRGAGNMLGAEQSGTMAAIGYDLYTELLEKAVRELKGEKFLDEIDPEFHFKMPSYIPDDYIADPPVRLELYRQLSSLEEENDIDGIEDDLRDRFGAPPPEVENLLQLSVIKVYAKKLRIKQVRYDGRHFMYAFDPSTTLPPEILTDRIKKDPKRYRLTPDLRLIVTFPMVKENLALVETKKFLRELGLHLAL